MNPRPAVLRHFLTNLEAALRPLMTPAHPASPMLGRALEALQHPAPCVGLAAEERLPVLEHLPRVLSSIVQPGSPVAEVGVGLRELAPELRWRRRAGSDSAGRTFADGHANALVVGPEALERRRDVVVGLSLMAPEVRYPDHSHPPEEVYLVLTPGEWWQAGGAWHAPGAGGLVHNPPGIKHAMRSAGTPLLAVWVLWTQA